MTTNDPLKNLDYFEALDKYRQNFPQSNAQLPYGILVGSPDTLQLVKAMYGLNTIEVLTKAKVSSWLDQAIDIADAAKAKPNFMIWAMYENFTLPSAIMHAATAICSVTSNPITINWIKNRFGVSGKIVEDEVIKEELVILRPIKEYDLLPPPSAEYQAAISRWMDEDNDW